MTPSRYFFGLASVLGVLFALVSEVDDASLTRQLLHFPQWQLQTLGPMAVLIGIQKLGERWRF